VHEACLFTFASGGWNSSGVAIADVNGDGLGDVLVANFCPLGGCPNGPGPGVVGVLLSDEEYPTTIALISNLNPSIYGQSVTFTAKILSPTVKAKGPVTFTAGKTVLGTAQLDSNSKATVSISSLPAGSNTVTASYKGDSDISGSSASVTQVVQ